MNKYLLFLLLSLLITSSTVHSQSKLGNDTESGLGPKSTIYSNGEKPDNLPEAANQWWDETINHEYMERKIRAVNIADAVISWIFIISSPYANPEIAGYDKNDGKFSSDSLETISGLICGYIDSETDIQIDEKDLIFLFSCQTEGGDTRWKGKWDGNNFIEISKEEIWEE